MNLHSSFEAMERSIKTKLRRESLLKLFMDRVGYVCIKERENQSLNNRRKTYSKK